MKAFELDHSHKSNPIVFIDMDGVLADLESAVSADENHKQIARQPGFFRHLSTLPNAEKLIKGVIHAAGSYKILSSPLMSAVTQSSKEKTEWLQRHYAKYPPSGVIFEHQKEKYACQADGTPNVLIDDFDANIKLWESQGGIGILYEDAKVDAALRRLHYALEGLIPVTTKPVSDVKPKRSNKLYTNKDVVKYVQGVHHDYTLVEPINDYKVWKLGEIPVSYLKTPEFAEQDDPYRRSFDLDWDHINKITPKEILSKPIVINDKGWVLDGNHRVTAARMLGLLYIQALIPWPDSNSL